MRLFIWQQFSLQGCIRPLDTVNIYRAPGWFHTNIVPDLIVSMFYLFLKCCLPALMPELVKIYNSGNSAEDISRIIYLGGCFDYENINHKLGTNNP